MFNNLTDIMKDKDTGSTIVMTAEKGKSYLMTLVYCFIWNLWSVRVCWKKEEYVKVAETFKPLMDKVYNYPEEHQPKMP